ncbi:unnamed protein product [Prorocentrum cordatum]|uniref:Uncharacterized protein n=1 Tax=Prorocentrum cordatum TaxID=2364126 RepID=A0ABN9TDE2_9DINO|nr:unnamed protein product [Polarella glacialis]
MVSRMVGRLRSAYENSRDAVRTIGEVVEEHKALLWLMGTASSGLAGWAVYTARRLHYARVEGEMNHLSEKIEAMLGRKQEVPPEPEQPQLNMRLVLVPSVMSAFLVGYVAGRTQSSYRWHRQMRVNEGLSNKRRVYVAVIPEQLFSAPLLASELERAVGRADAERGRSWLGGWRGDAERAERG